jgi:hypothetical protein
MLCYSGCLQGDRSSERGADRISVQYWAPDGGITWHRINPNMESKAIIDYDKFGMQDGATVWEQYLISFFWVCTTITGNGSIGDVMPQNMVEIIYCIGLMIVSLVLFRCLTYML